MSAVIAELKQYQVDRNLHTMGYDDLNEHTNIIEELLESVGLDIPKENREKLKEAWSEFAIFVGREGIGTPMSIENLTPEIEEHGKVDAYGDNIVFSVGAILKLGYEPEDVMREVLKEINSRTGSIVNGKFEKDLSDEAKAKWYKADFSTCKIKKD
jgi:hypothetical protein